MNTRTASAQTRQPEKRRVKYLTYITMSLMFIVACSNSSALREAQNAGPTVEAADLVRVAGSGWAGELVYRDYSPPFGNVTLQVEAKVSVVPDGLLLQLMYPQEPHANSTDLLAVSPDGKTFGGDPVIAHDEQAGILTIITRADCEDDERAAVCENFYTFGKSVMGIRKMVSFPGETAALQRNEFVFRR